MLGARCVATLLNEMKRRGRDSRFGIISMCIGISLYDLYSLSSRDEVEILTFEIFQKIVNTLIH